MNSSDFARFLMQMGQDPNTSNDNLDDPAYANGQQQTDVFAPVPFTPWAAQAATASTQTPAVQARTIPGARGGGSPGGATQPVNPGASSPSQMSASSGPHMPGSDPIVNYIREAATKRGIDPDIALRVAAAEGGRNVTNAKGLREPDFSQPWQPAIEGSFATGHSWWPYQLHYGGAGTPYSKYGTVAGMGNDFTAATGYQPGDPAALNASIDFALDQALKTGWGRWYGARAAGVGDWDGLPR